MADHLFHSSLSPSPPSRAILYDEALVLANKNETVDLLYCNGLMSQCFCNMDGNKITCALCKVDYQNEKCRFIGKINFIPMPDYITQEQIEDIDNIKFTYNSVADIKNLTYHGVNIGLGALSAYISHTRNLDPEFNSSFRLFFDEILKNSVKTTVSVASAIDRCKPKDIYLYNGRFAESRPIWELAQRYEIPFVVLEAVYGIKRNFKERFYNEIPHSIAANARVINYRWNNSSLDEKEKIEIGSSFFQRRRNALYTGDKIYVANQEKGLLPIDWDSSVKNIVIFNSSEDEYASLGDEYDKYKLFKSQLEGLNFIKKQFENNQSVKITLRIHPNLSNIKYSYVSNLRELDGGNFKVIDGSSDISSYALLDSADVVVVFGSTMGVESNYWRKPTILLAGAIYYDIGVCYIPKSQDEMMDMLNAKLTPKDNFAAIKCGFYYMEEREEYFSYLNFDWELFNVNICGFNKTLQLSNWQKIIGSRKLFLIIRFIKKIYLKFYYNLCGGYKRFIIPTKERQ